MLPSTTLWWIHLRPEKIEIPVYRTQIISGEEGSDSTKVFKFVHSGSKYQTTTL